MNQLKSCARELDVSFNVVEVTQHPPPHARIATIQYNHIRTPNFLNYNILSLSRHSIHLRDADQPFIANVIQQVLHTQSWAIILNLPCTPSPKHTDSSFHILGRPYVLKPYTYRQKLHNWFTTILNSTVSSPIAEDYLMDHQHTVMLLHHTLIPIIINQVKHIYTQHLFYFLVYAKWINKSPHTSTTPLPAPIPTTVSL